MVVMKKKKMTRIKMGIKMKEIKMIRKGRIKMKMETKIQMNNKNKVNNYLVFIIFLRGNIINKR